jgi:hypothetical protein
MMGIADGGIEINRAIEGADERLPSPLSFKTKQAVSPKRQPLAQRDTSKC